jgi:type IV pilus assembly protein PilN
MIKLNLLGDDTVIDTTGTWILIGYGFSLAVVILSMTVWFFSISASVEEMTGDASNLETQLKNLQEVTKEVRELDTKKKELSDKTSVIATLKKSKLGPVKILDDLNIAIPEKIWLSEFKETGGVARISGSALDNQTVAIFIKKLEESDYFDKIDPSQSVIAPMQGVNVQNFVLQAKVNYAGFGKVRVVTTPTPSSTPAPTPVSEAVSSPTPTSGEVVTEAVQNAGGTL